MPRFPVLQALQRLQDDLANAADGLHAALDDLPSLAGAKGTGPRLFCGHVPKASLSRPLGTAGLPSRHARGGADGLSDMPSHRAICGLVAAGARRGVAPTLWATAGGSHSALLTWLWAVPLAAILPCRR